MPAITTKLRRPTRIPQLARTEQPAIAAPIWLQPNRSTRTDATHDFLVPNPREDLTPEPAFFGRNDAV